MDLSSGFDIANPYGLLAADFNYDMDGYGVALRFLGDLAGGTAEKDALALNGGSRAMLTAWRGSDKFRRVYAKCKQAGVAARAYAEAQANKAAEAAGSPQEATEGDTPRQPPTQGWVPLEEAPVQRRGLFAIHPPRGSWGSE